MSKQDQTAADARDSGDAEGDGDEYTAERRVTRGEGAAFFRRLADSVAAGSVELGDEHGVAVPDRFELEIEFEQDRETVELDVELEWPVVDGEAVAAERESEAGDGGELVGRAGVAGDARFELYRDRADEWRWRLVHGNGNVIADSGEGYTRKEAARNGLESVVRNASGAAVVTLDD